MQVTDEPMNADRIWTMLQGRIFLCGHRETFRESFDFVVSEALSALSKAEPVGVGDGLKPIEKKYLPLAKEFVKGNCFNHPDPRDDDMRLVGFRVPVEVAGLGEALFALDAIRAVMGGENNG